MTDWHANQPPESAEQIHQALKLWHKDPSHGSPIDHLLLVQRRAVGTGGNIRQATNQVLLQGLQAMEMQHPAETSLLRERFLDQQMVHVIANRRNLAEASIYRLQSRALDLLRETLSGLEQQARHEKQTTLYARLEPPTYVTLVGVQRHLALLVETLHKPGPPFLLSVEGMGGIGKTSLADALVRRTIANMQFDEIAWVSARRQQLVPSGTIRPIAEPALSAQALIESLAIQLIPEVPAIRDLSQAIAALRARLSGLTALVVIDNLETVADVATLLPAVRQLADPSHLLLTSRQSLYDEPDIFHFPVPELDETDALNLVRQEGQLRNLPHLYEASDDDLRPIYETVGGNPLALKLVVGQTHVHSLYTVLQDLAGVRSTPAESLYTFIYQKAWDNLDELGRQVLLAMPLVAESGGPLEYLEQITQLDPADLRTALNQLVSLNLVESRGGLRERLFTIHNLTRTFLLEQVLRWQEAESRPDVKPQK